MPPLFLLLIVGLPLVESNVTSATNVTKAVPALWTFKVTCHECMAENTFDCSRIRTCEYDIRRCMTLAARVSPRLIIVYKNCTWNCTFVYAAEQPRETPRRAPRNHFYFANCCNGMNCNSGGPTNIERDIYLAEGVEELLPESAYLGKPGFFLSFASVIVSNIMT